MNKSKEQIDSGIRWILASIIAFFLLCGVAVRFFQADSLDSFYYQIGRDLLSTIISILAFVAFLAVGLIYNWYCNKRDR